MKHILFLYTYYNGHIQDYTFASYIGIIRKDITEKIKQREKKILLLVSPVSIALFSSLGRQRAIKEHEEIEMRNVTARISDQLYQALLTFCGENGTNVNQCLSRAVQGLLQGEVKMLPMGGTDVCPRCGHVAHIIQDNSKFYFWCHRCDWCAFLGKFTLPANIEDWTEKIKER